MNCLSLTQEANSWPVCPSRYTHQSLSVRFFFRKTLECAFSNQPLLFPSQNNLLDTSKSRVNLSHSTQTELFPKALQISQHILPDPSAVFGSVSHKTLLCTSADHETWELTTCSVSTWLIAYSLDPTVLSPWLPHIPECTPKSHDISHAFCCLTCTFCTSSLTLVPR